MLGCMTNSDVEPVDEAEAFRKMVADRLELTDSYVDLAANQVDGSLQDVIDAVLAAYSEYKMRRLNEITDPRAFMEEAARLP